MGDRGRHGGRRGDHAVHRTRRRGGRAASRSGAARCTAVPCAVGCWSLRAASERRGAHRPRAPACRAPAVPVRPPTGSSSRRTRPSTDAVELLPYLDALGVGARSTRRRCWSRARAPTTATTWSTRPGSPPSAAARRGRARSSARLRERGPAASCSTSCPTTSASTVAQANPWWWDVLRARPRVARTPATSTSTGTPGRLLLPVLDADEEKALSRARAVRRPDRAALLRARRSRSRPAPARRLPAGGARAPALPARLLAARRGGADLPALLRRVHARRGARRGPGGVRGHPRGSAALGRRRGGRRPAGRPPGRAVRPRRLRCGGCGPRSARTGGWWSRRSSGSARRCRASWPVDGTSGYDALREIRGRVRRPGRGGAAHPVRRRAHRRQGVAARGRARRAAGGRRHDPRGGGAPHRRARPSERPAPREPAKRPRARRRRRAALRLPRLPLLPPRGPVGARRRPCSVARHATAPTSPTCSARLYRRRCSPTRAASSPPGSSRPRGMVMAKGVEDTAFYRWNRFVALNEVGGDPARFGVVPAEFHAAIADREARLAGHDDHAVHPRHQALGGRPRPARRARGDPRRVGRRAVRALGARAHPLPDRVARAARLAEPRRRLADPGRSGSPGTSPRRLEGGQARHQPRRRGRRRWTRRSRAWPAAVLADADARRRDRGVRRADHRARLVELAGPEAAPARRARACPTSTRAPSCSSSRWSTRTTAARSTSAAPRAARPARRRLAARRRRGRARRSCWSPRSALRLRRTGRRCSPGYRPLPAEGPAARARGGVRPLGVARRGGHAAPGRAGRARRLGRHGAPAARGAADWCDVVTGAAVDGPRRRWRGLLARYPVALLVRPA